ncbi:hypothetical protein CRG98_033728 [Punica granatum]|uniref:Uncharacterized protein n=1 Tax=Punica granatum TaxID=22663 RepID=A0A2I0IPL7_PUNGR|nr:hypothetical protein CRG98_033728 [Punica granatum]
MDRSESPIGGPYPKSIKDSKSEVPGCRYSWRTLVTSVEGLGSLIDSPIPNRPRTSSRKSPVDSGLGPPIGDPYPSTEVASVGAVTSVKGVRVADRQPQPRIDRQPPTRSRRSIRGWGRRSATLTPPSRSSTSFVGTDDLIGGVGVAD